MSFEQLNFVLLDVYCFWSWKCCEIVNKICLVISQRIASAGGCVLVYHTDIWVLSILHDICRGRCVWIKQKAVQGGAFCRIVCADAYTDSKFDPRFVYRQQTKNDRANTIKILTIFSFHYSHPNQNNLQSKKKHLSHCSKSIDWFPFLNADKKGIFSDLLTSGVYFF